MCDWDKKMSTHDDNNPTDRSAQGLASHSRFDAALLGAAQAQADDAARLVTDEASRQTAQQTGTHINDPDRSNQVRESRLTVNLSPPSVQTSLDYWFKRCLTVRTNTTSPGSHSPGVSRPPRAKRKRPTQDTDSESDTDCVNTNLNLAKLVYESTGEQLETINNSLRPLRSKSDTNLSENKTSNMIKPTRSHCLLSDVSQPRPSRSGDLIQSLVDDVISLYPNETTMAATNNLPAHPPLIQVNALPNNINTSPPPGPSNLNLPPPPTGGQITFPNVTPDSPPALVVNIDSNNHRQVTTLNDQLTINVNVSKPKSVSFQIPQGAGPAAEPDTRPQRIPVPDGADETWKLTRKHLSNAAKATARADHLEYLARKQIIPSWTIGAETLPGYIKPLIEQLGSLKHMHALETLGSMAEQLRTSAHLYRQRGTAQRMVLEQLYGTDIANFNASINRINELVARDETECKTALTKRTQSLESNPVSMAQVQDFLLQQSNIYTRFGQNQATNPVNEQQAPTPSTSQAGLPNGNTNVQTNTGNQRSARPRGRGNFRGRFATRGNRGRGGFNQRGRGRGLNRSRSNSRTRSNSRSRGNMDTSNLTPDELRVLQAYRSSK